MVRVRFLSFVSYLNLDKEIIESIQKEEHIRYIKELYYKLNNCSDKLTLEDLSVLMKLQKRSTIVKLDFGDDGYFIIKKDIEKTLELHEYTRSMLYCISHMITHDGRLKYGNNRIVPSLSKLKEYLKISNDKWNKYIKPDIEKYIILKKESIDNKWCILLNPIYATTTDFTLEQYHINLFGEEVFKLYYFTTKDIQVIEKYRHLLSDLEYKKMSFKLNPSENYIVFNEDVIDYGIYLLYNNENIVYIGKSNNMKNRINQHKKDKEFNSVKCIIFKDEGLVNLYEPYLIQKYKPKYNKDLLNCQE